jgi:dual specificity MAP kinase phosphatase
MFNHVCSSVLDGFMYLGSDNVAKDYNKLKENGITHVINCAADYSADYHLDKGIKDHVRENIESIFYEAIEFFNKAKEENGRVFVHCVQGISRSSTICLSYMIFT